MMETIQSYFDVLIRERSWSWSIVGIIYLVLGYLIRGWFLKPLANAAKTLAPKQYQEIKRAYLRRSLVGWITFLIPLAILGVFWTQTDLFPISGKEAISLIAALAFFILSVMFHLGSFAHAGIDTLRHFTPEK
ncbi:MAG: hypothetical protein Q8R76_08605 [Candidatus Omnitrophota bacterium]|nr:hypothetical protein [Candidatus Omnitrophota bacterium]